MTAMVVGVALATLAIIITVEGLVAEHQRRKAQTGSVMLAGAIGIAFFIAVLAAAGAL